MLRFTKRADYGLMAVYYIAAHPDEAAVSAKRIAEEFNIPAELLAKILQRLAKKKLIVSHNGPKGGYVLARPRHDITVGQVLRALEGPVQITSCVVDDPGEHHLDAGRHDTGRAWRRRGGSGGGADRDPIDERGDGDR